MEGDVKMEKIKREKLIMKIICTSLAVILWFYVSYFENPTMTKTVDDVPVTITDEQLDRLEKKGLSIQYISKDSVDVKVTARRLTLATQTRRSLSAYVNISSISKSGTYYLPANVVSDDGADATYYVKAKDIKVVVEPILTGSFNVEADLDNQYIAYNGYRLSSDTVKVSAPKSIFDEIYSIKTEHLILDDRIEIKERDLVLYDKDGNVLDSEKVSFTPSNIDIMFSYLDEKTVPVIIPMDSGKEITLPEKYDIDIYGDAETIDAISYIKTENLDLTQYDENSTVKLRLYLPYGIKVNEDSKQVEIKIDSSFFE
ncbi:MAG: hypothetical protein E7406_03820 [Ruminococcaceae bacterium]|nr:hypothetical protein [Oscillospiraceae bacterium]